MGYITQRVAILIDEVNIFLTAKGLYGNAKLDIEAVLKRLNHREIVRVIMYCVKTPENNISTIRNVMNGLDVEVKSKPIKIFSNGKRKGDWDIGLVLDAVEIKNRVDVITLVTGDGDFEDLANYLKYHGMLSHCTRDIVHSMSFEPVIIIWGRVIMQIRYVFLDICICPVTETIWTLMGPTDKFIPNTMLWTFLLKKCMSFSFENILSGRLRKSHLLNCEKIDGYTPILFF